MEESLSVVSVSQTLLICLTSSLAGIAEDLGRCSVRKLQTSLFYMLPDMKKKVELYNEGSATHRQFSAGTFQDDLSRVYPASCSMSAGIGSNPLTTLKG